MGFGCSGIYQPLLIYFCFSSINPTDFLLETVFSTSTYEGWRTGDATKFSYKT